MRKLLILALMILPLAVVGCSKGPAEAALKAADEAIAKVKPEAEKYVPAELKGLADAAAEAKTKFDAGDYSAALAGAKELPARAADVAKAAAAKKDELTAKWNEFQGSLPGVVQGLTDKVNTIATMKRLPKGFEAAQLESAKTSLSDVTGIWTAATEAFAGGDVAAALAKAGDVKTKAEELTKALETVQLPPAKQ
jgi:hypothetical protein